MTSITSIDARTGLQRIDREECLQLLGGDVVGRLAVVRGNAPVIFPVNYVLDGEHIVFRTAGGTKFEAAERGRACFEIDGIDRESKSGWSVIASGRLEEVTERDARTLRRIELLPVEPWASGAKAHWMRLLPDRITGRRVGPERRP